jgi:hypothetical protein
MKLKVIYEDTRIVVPFSESTLLGSKQIKDLITYLEEVLSKETGEEAKVPRLTTSDGFLLRNQDSVASVLSDNDVLQAMSMKGLITAEYKHLDVKNLWIELKRSDLKDNVDKWIRVGKHKNGKVFITLGTGNYTKQLYLLSVQDLEGVNAERVIAHLTDLENPDVWKIEAKLVPAKGLPSIVVSVKVSSEKQTWSDQLELELVKKSTGQVVTPGTVTHVSGSEVEEDEVNLDDAPVPEPKRTGPQLEIIPRPTLTAHQPEGASTIEILIPEDKIDSLVTVNQSMSARDGVFKSFFTINPVTFVNKESNPASIVNIDIQYKDHDGEWKNAADVRLGVAYQSRYGVEFSWFENGTHLNFIEHFTQTVALQCSVTAQGSPGSDNYRRARTPKSLPQPIQFKIRIQDDDNKQKTVIVEQANRPLDVSTKESQEKSWSKSIHAFVYCDDCEDDDRIYTAIYKDSDDIVLRFSHGTYYTLDSKYFKGLEFKAQETNVTEMELENFEYKTSTNEFKTTALFYKNKIYAFKIYLKSRTSETEEVVRLPL